MTNMVTSDDEGGKKRKRGSVSSHKDDEKKAKVLQEGKALAKKEFEADRAEILKSTPAEYKKMFGQIGFTKWNKVLIPVLILNPYHVPPGNVRQQWLDMHQKKKSQGKLHEMSYLVYWYGAKKESELYAYVGKKLFIAYDQEKAKDHKGVHKLSAKIQKKVDDETPLNPKEADTLRSYEEMEEDLLKEPLDRRRGILTFPEGYEMLSDRDMSGVDLEGADAEEDPFDDDPGLSDLFKEVAPPPKAVKAKAIPPPAAAKKAAVAKEKQSKIANKAVKLKTVKKAETAAAAAADDDEENIGEGVDESLAESEPEAASPVIAKKRGRPKTSEAKLAAVVPDKKSKSKKKPDVAAAVDENLKKASTEEKDFKQCQQAYLPMIKNWRSSIEDRDIESVQSQLHDLISVVEMFSVKFTKHHKLKELLQQTKEVLEEEEADLTSFDALTSKLWGSQASKRRAVPPAEVTAGLTVEAKIPAATGAVDSDDIGDNEDNEDNSGDDEKSVGYALEDDLSSHDDGADDDFVETGKGAAKSKSKGKLQKSTKDKPVKKTQKTKPKIDKPQTEKQLKRNEAKLFVECETNYLPLIQKWKAAIKSVDIQQLQSLIIEADSVVESFCATFIIAYELSDICKETKKALKSANADLTAYAALKEKIKVTYEQKQDQAPKGFKPTKAKSHVVAAMDKSSTKERLGDDDLDGSQRSTSVKNDLKAGVECSGKEKSTTCSSKSPSKMGDHLERSVASLKSLPRNNSLPNVGEVAVEGCTATARSAAPQKPKRKQFSLGSLMRPNACDTITRGHSAADVTKAAAAAAPTTVEQASVPLWVTGPAVTDAPIEDPRSLALEFLLQMAGHFPKGSVDVDSLARSVEAAVHEWAKKGSPGDGDAWTTNYWSKIHALIAAICGKQEKGTIQSLILQGRFDVPEKLVALSVDKLAASFEGRPLTV